MVYLKDARPTFSLATKEFPNPDKFVISRPDLVISAAQKDFTNRRIIRESKRKEAIKLKARKEQNF